MNQNLDEIKVSKDMTIGEIIVRYPQSAEFFQKRGWGCFGCPMASMETLEQGAAVHGIQGKALEKLLTELRKFLAE